MSKDKQEDKVVIGHCKNCGRELYQKKTGRPPVFCSTKCRVIYWRKSKDEGEDE